MAAFYGGLGMQIMDIVYLIMKKKLRFVDILKDFMESCRVSVSMMLTGRAITLSDGMIMKNWRANVY